jgi:iron complex transport system substrate-binding protein
MRAGLFSLRPARTLVRHLPAAAILSLAAAGGMAPAAAQDALPRVMSLNVCTDQLVMALAEPQQIVSLSALSADPSLSYYAGTTGGIAKNVGLAEEVFVVRPDIVVTGTYSLHNTTELLRHLGIRVEEFDYAQTLDSIPAETRRMGAILGHAARGAAMAASFEAELAALRAEAPAARPSVVVYGQNGVVLGADTLADTVLEAAGFRNLAAERGYSGMAPYPLELLIRDRPDVVLLSPPYADAPALADQFVRHPAIEALQSIARSDVVPRGAWGCAGPFTIEAVRALAALRREIAGGLSAPPPGASSQ